MIARISKLNHFRSTDRERGALATSIAHSGMPVVVKLPHGAKLYPTALQLPPHLALGTWEAVGVQLANTGKSIQWALGDWWTYGYHAYGERKAKAKAKGIPFEFGTLMNYGYVARGVATSLRNEALSFSHYYAIAHLEPEDQKKWLAKAVRGKWSVEALRRHLNERTQDDLGDHLDDHPDARAHCWAESLIEEAHEAAKAYRYWDDSPLDYLSVDAVSGLVKELREVVATLADRQKGLEQYLKRRLAKGSSFVPRPLEPIGVPRAGNRTYDFKGDPIDERQAH